MNPVFRYPLYNKYLNLNLRRRNVEVGVSYNYYAQFIGKKSMVLVIPGSIIHIIKRAVFLPPSVRPFSNKIGKTRSENVNKKEINSMELGAYTKQY